MSALTIIPPRDSSNCIAIIGNGEIEAENLGKRLKEFNQVIAVDAGFHHCKKLQITPQWIVGDFDSVDPVVLQQYNQVNQEKLERTKNQSDLSGAVQKALHISHTAQIIIFGGLGGRLDHTLSNVLMLLCYPTQVFLESENQLIFGLKKGITVELHNEQWKSFALLPLYGAAQDISIKNDQQIYNLGSINKSREYVFPLKGKTTLSLQQGELIVVLSKVAPTFPSLPDGSFNTSFRLEKPFTLAFRELLHQSKTMNLVLFAEEEVSHLKPGKTNFNCSAGTTVSLIPFYGPIKGITTQGLGWELTNGALNKDYIGLSNIALHSSFSIEFQEGELLCILNRKIIDLDMVQRLKT